MNHRENERFQRVERIKDRYGELLTIDEVAEVLKYRTSAAVRKAHYRKKLPVRLYRFEGRSGMYAKAEDIADSIDRMS